MECKNHVLYIKILNNKSQNTSTQIFENFQVYNTLCILSVVNLPSSQTA